MAFHHLSAQAIQEYMKAPGGKPPPGVIPNYHDPQNTLSQGLSALNILGLLLVTSFVSIRMYTRTFILKSLWWDDCMWLAGAHLMILLISIRRPLRSSMGRCNHLFKGCFILHVNLRQVLFVVFIATGYKLIDAGAGVHQWDLHYYDVVLSSYVSRRIHSWLLRRNR